MDKAIKVIDCDVHNQYGSHENLLPYLKEPWKGMVERAGILNGGLPYRSPVGVLRRDAYPPNGGIPGSDPAYMSEHLVEAFNMEYAILSGDGLIGISTLPDPDYANGIASAYNDYLIEEWLSKNPKFKGAILIANQDPYLAAKEIDRVGQHPGMVEVVMTSASRTPYGQRFFHPIYEAAQRNHLPVKLHPGAEGSGTTFAPTAAGYPTNYLQWHTCLSQNFMAHLVSLVCDGVFEKFPQLKFVLCEGGVAWLPHLMWRMDKNYKALRSTAPWLKKMPSQYIREHCYLTTQPIEEPDDFNHLKAIFEMIDAENILLFSSDYPHWDFDDPTKILRRLPEQARRKIFYENARNLYNLN